MRSSQGLMGIQYFNPYMHGKYKDYTFKENVRIFNPYMHGKYAFFKIQIIDLLDIQLSDNF